MGSNLSHGAAAMKIYLQQALENAGCANVTMCEFMYERKKEGHCAAKTFLFSNNTALYSFYKSYMHITEGWRT
jgi:hypothetical protein